MSYFSNNYGAVQYTLASENSVGLRNAQIGAIHETVGRVLSAAAFYIGHTGRAKELKVLGSP